ncbi:MAG TPA: CHAT domain-containing protein, partial [Polyangiaceae bacterium LLY-WYZ-15_(1-7)]|nr:CHAT domain-containing protein [Polyangiaceae bacterium LLY-WYZ-15_(1-7)]
LALPAAPESVLLSGCETGQPAEELALGLANAFLATGARRVVGTTRAVDDATAASVGGALEREARAPWPERLRRLVAERGDEVGAYRVYVP